MSQIFSAYTFESSLLDIASGFLDKDVFLHIEDAENKRKRGWTPKSQGCEACGRKLFGKELGVDVWDAWKKRTDERQQRRNEHWGIGAGEGLQELDTEGIGGGTKARPGAVRRTLTAEQKGKGRASLADEEERGALSTQMTSPAAAMGPQALIVFACGHSFHRSCLRMRNGEAVHEEQDDDGHQEGYSCPACHVVPDVDM